MSDANRIKQAGNGAGFSLPELLVAMLVGSMVMAALFRFLVPTVQTLGAVNAGLIADNNGQVALAHIRSALRGEGNWQCLDPAPGMSAAIGGGKSQSASEALLVASYLPDLPHGLSDHRVSGTDVLWIGRRINAAGSVCTSPVTHGDLYYIGQSIADRPALFRQQVLPLTGRRQELVAGVVALRFRFATEGERGQVRWLAGDQLTESSAVHGVSITLALTEPASGGQTGHTVRFMDIEQHYTTPEPSIMRVHSTVVRLSDSGVGSP